jgi:hypothetical protein
MGAVHDLLSELRACSQVLFAAEGFTPRVGNILGTKSPEYHVRPAIQTEEKAKRANKMHIRRVFCNQGVGSSTHLRSTNLSNVVSLI